MVRLLSKALANEFAARGIRSNSVSPGPTRTAPWETGEFIDALAVEWAIDREAAIERFVRDVAACRSGASARPRTSPRRSSSWPPIARARSRAPTIASTAAWSDDLSPGPPRCALRRSPGPSHAGAARVERLDLGPGQARHVVLDRIADLRLHVGEVAVALGEAASSCGSSSSRAAGSTGSARSFS